MSGTEADLRSHYPKETTHAQRVEQDAIDTPINRKSYVGFSDVLAGGTKYKRAHRYHPLFDVLTNLWLDESIRDRLLLIMAKNCQFWRPEAEGGL